MSILCTVRLQQVSDINTNEAQRREQSEKNEKGGRKNDSGCYVYGDFGGKGRMERRRIGENAGISG